VIVDQIIESDAVVPDEEVILRELWEEFAEREFQAGRVTRADADRALRAEPPEWFDRWANVIIIVITSTDDPEGRP